MTLPQLPTSKPIRAASGPLGSSPEAWVVGWSSGNGLAGPYVVTIGSSLTTVTPPAADVALVTATWSDGPAATTLADFGVIGFSPPTGQGGTLLAAIDAAVLAAAVAYAGTDVLEDVDGLLRQTIATTWLIWVINGGLVLPGGGGGQLQTLFQALG